MRIFEIRACWGLRTNNKDSYNILYKNKTHANAYLYFILGSFRLVDLPAENVDIGNVDNVDLLGNGVKNYEIWFYGPWVFLYNLNTPVYCTLLVYVCSVF